MRTADLCKFIRARDEVRAHREAGMEKPWTDDSILQRFRFCNVRREDDTVTKWIERNWRTPNKNNPDNWFAMAVARWINWPETLAEIGYPIPWHPTRMIRLMKGMREREEKVWTGAYMIGTQGNSRDKIEFVVFEVLDKMWKNRDELRPRKDDTLHLFDVRLRTQYAMAGGFMGGQVIADIKYSDKFLLQATDWYTFAVSGPGSRRGLNRVMGQRPDTPWSESLWKGQHDRLFKEVQKELPVHMLDHAQDLQNCLCEFDKYERVRLGEGQPRSTYPGV